MTGATSADSTFLELQRALMTVKPDPPTMMRCYGELVVCLDAISLSRRSYEFTVFIDMVNDRISAQALRIELVPLRTLYSDAKEHGLTVGDDGYIYVEDKFTDHTFTREGILYKLSRSPLCLDITLYMDRCTEITGLPTLGGAHAFQSTDRNRFPGVTFHVKPTLAAKKKLRNRR